MFQKQIRPALLSFVILTILTGIVYPFLVTGLAQLLFPRQANGSLIYREGKAVGSIFIGQAFDNPGYFWGRLSATSPVPYNAASSSGSSLGPANPALIDEVKARIDALQRVDPDNKSLIPVDLVTSSASGLDPHISLSAADYQVPRVARFRTLPQDTVEAVVRQHVRHRFLGWLGEPVVNVLETNLALDQLGNK